MKKTYTRIIIIANCHIGDTIMLSPAIQRIRDINPDAHITAMVAKNIVELIDDTNVVNRVCYLDDYTVKSLWKGALSFRKEKYDIAFFFSVSKKFSFFIKFLSNIPERVCPKTYFLYSKRATARFYATKTIALPHDISTHHTDHFVDVVNTFFQTKQEEKPVLHVKSSETLPRTVEAFLKTDTTKILINFSSSRRNPSKWTHAYQVELIQRLSARGYDIVMPCIPKEIPLYEKLAHDAERLIHIFPLGLLESATLAGKVALVISVDTGMAHLGAAMGTPTLSLANTTIQSTYPYADNSLALGTVYGCDVCDAKRCELKNATSKKDRPDIGYVPPCMEALTPEIVERYAVDLLEGRHPNVPYVIVPHDEREREREREFKLIKKRCLCKWAPFLMTFQISATSLSRLSPQSA